MSNHDVDDLTYVIDTDDLDPAERVLTEVDGIEVAVFNVNGEFHAMMNYCVHQGGPACEGLVSGMISAGEDRELVYDRENEIVSCPWHGWEFDILTGEHLADASYQIPTYETVVQDGKVYLKVS